MLGAALGLNLVRLPHLEVGRRYRQHPATHRHWVRQGTCCPTERRRAKPSDARKPQKAQAVGIVRRSKWTTSTSQPVSAHLGNCEDKCPKSTASRRDAKRE
jgi:hypothetical protein